MFNVKAGYQTSGLYLIKLITVQYVWFSGPDVQCVNKSRDMLGFYAENFWHRALLEKCSFLVRELNLIKWHKCNMDYSTIISPVSSKVFLDD